MYTLSITMPTLTDFTFNNEKIKNYFDGDDSYLPNSELMYLHSHPLVRPNFLTQIEDLIKQTSELMMNKKMKGPIVERFTTLVRNFAIEVNNFTDLDAGKTLHALREIYSFCLSLLGNYQIVNK